MLIILEILFFFRLDKEIFTAEVGGHSRGQTEAERGQTQGQSGEVSQFLRTDGIIWIGNAPQIYLNFPAFTYISRSISYKTFHIS